MACIVGAIGYALLLSWQHGPRPTPGPAPLAPSAATARPDRLAPDPAIRSRVQLAEQPARRERQRRLTVRVEGIDPRLANGTAGVAVFTPAVTGAMAWLPLSVGSVCELTTTVAGDGPFRITLADSAAEARFHFLTVQDLTPGDSDDLQVTLRAALQQVAFRSVGAHDGAVWRLVRRDQPEWSPSATAAAGITGTTPPTELWLGVGDYEIQDPLDPRRRRAFLVPGPAEVPLSAEPAGPAGGRP